MERRLRTVTVHAVRLLLLLQWTLVSSEDTSDTSALLGLIRATPMVRRQTRFPQCSEPRPPANGFRVGNAFYPGYSVRFGCREGYSLVGSEVLTCRYGTYDVYWDAEIPLCAGELYISRWFILPPFHHKKTLMLLYIHSCTEILCHLLPLHTPLAVIPGTQRDSADPCGVPPSPSSSAFIVSYTEGVSVQYSCVRGYTVLTGSDQLMCENGAWQGSPLDCRREHESS